MVILDIQMPGRTGLSLAASLPADDRPEVIFVTAFGQYAPDAFDAEAADYMLKPVRIDRLRQAIERARSPWCWKPRPRCPSGPTTLRRWRRR